MEFILFAAAVGLTVCLLAIAVISERPQASLARGILASAGAVAGAWISTSGLNGMAVGETALIASLLRMLG